VEGPIAVEREVALLQDPGCGGVAVFLGTVRDEFEGRPSRGLVYQAYVPLAEKELARIGAELQAEFGARRVVLVHRVGTLALGEISVLVGVATPHREAAFLAARAGIDRIKQRVPIWKKELWAEGGASWHYERPSDRP
jgi:molybdopterin synthase catalytic subunit